MRAPAELDVMNCNCSMCLKKGRVYHLPVPVKAVDFSSGSSDMSVYSYGTDGCKHLFCAICGACAWLCCLSCATDCLGIAPWSTRAGIHLVNTSRASSSVFDVNVSCLDPRTIKSIAVHSFDGQNFDEAFGVLKAEKEAELALRRSDSSVASQKPRGALEPRPALAATLAALHGDSALRPSGPGFTLDASFDDARSVDSSVSRRSDVTLQAPVRIHPAVAVKPLSASNGDGLLISSRSSDDRVKAGNLASLVSGAGSTLPAPISVAADGLGEDQRDDDGASSSGDSDIGAITRQALKRDSRAGGHLAIPVRRSAQYAGQQM